jgi:hypothetical protein
MIFRNLVISFDGTRKVSGSGGTVHPLNIPEPFTAKWDLGRAQDLSHLQQHGASVRHGV